MKNFSQRTADLKHYSESFKPNEVNTQTIVELVRSVCQNYQVRQGTTKTVTNHLPGCFETLQVLELETIMNLVGLYTWNTRLHETLEKRDGID